MWSSFEILCVLFFFSILPPANTLKRLLIFFQERGSHQAKRSHADNSVALQCNQKEVEQWQPNLPGVSRDLPFTGVRMKGRCHQCLLLRKNPSTKSICVNVNPLNCPGPSCSKLRIALCTGSQ